MQRSSSGGEGPTAQHNREVHGQVVVLDAWKSKKKQRERREQRHKRRRQGGLLRTLAWTVLVLEVLAVVGSCIPSPYELHCIILAWMLGIIAGLAGLWLNVRVDALANRVLLYSGIGMLVALIAGFVKMAA